MPDGSGFELLDVLAAREDLKTVPKLVLTSLELDRDRRKKLVHADDVISKGELSADLLISKINKAMIDRAA